MTDKSIKYYNVEKRCNKSKPNNIPRFMFFITYI